MWEPSGNAAALHGQTGKSHTKQRKEQAVPSPWASALYSLMSLATKIDWIGTLYPPECAYSDSLCADRSVAALNPCPRTHHRYVTAPAAWVRDCERAPCSPSAETITAYLDQWNVCFWWGGGACWEFVSMSESRAEEGSMDRLQLCSCLANSRSSHHSHSSHTEQCETVAPLRHIKQDFLPFPRRLN